MVVVVVVATGPDLHDCCGYTDQLVDLWLTFTTDSSGYSQSAGCWQTNLVRVFICLHNRIGVNPIARRSDCLVRAMEWRATIAVTGDDNDCTAVVACDKLIGPRKPVVTITTTIAIHDRPDDCLHSN